jgi:hypothetical protein
MNPIGKKFISLFLVFSLLMLSVNLYAKRRGAKLTITKKDGHLIRGELIAVKEHSILLLSATDVSIDIADIKVITIVKKSRAGIGALSGLLIGGVIGAKVASWEEKESFLGELETAAEAVGGFAVGLISGALLGGIIGAVVGTDKTIQIEGMTDSEIKKALSKLRKKARIRDYK